MRVIRKGKKELIDPTYRGECGSCECIVECKSKELRYDDDPREQGNNTAHVKCPCCKNLIWMSIVP